MKDRLAEVKARLDERMAVAAPIAAETGMHPVDVCVVLIELNDDADKARDVCCLSAQTGIHPLVLLAPASKS